MWHTSGVCVSVRCLMRLGGGRKGGGEQDGYYCNCIGNVVFICYCCTTTTATRSRPRWRVTGYRVAGQSERHYPRQLLYKRAGGDSAQVFGGVGGGDKGRPFFGGERGAISIVVRYGGGGGVGSVRSRACAGSTKRSRLRVRNPERNGARSRPGTRYSVRSTVTAPFRLARRRMRSFFAGPLLLRHRPTPRSRWWPVRRLSL